MPNIPFLGRGKVLDVYRVDDERVLYIYTDRVSLSNETMANGAPRIGQMAAKLSWFWHEKLSTFCRSSFLTNRLSEFPKEFQEYGELLYGRSIIAKKLEIIPIECVVRGNLSGSAWRDYLSDGSVCGHYLPENMHENDKLAHAIFTPSTKVAAGTERNITLAEGEDLVGSRTMFIMESNSRRLYNAAASYALMQGIILADTKFVFGKDQEGDIYLAGEILTPSTSSFWDVNYQSDLRYDNGYVREHLKQNGRKELPTYLPEDILNSIYVRHYEAYAQITGNTCIAN